MSRTSPRTTGKTALITGASGGIGLELARIFSRNGFNLAIIATNEQRLNEVKQEIEKSAGVPVKVIAKDLSREEAPQEIYDELQSEGMRVDVLVNNAGYSIYGKFTETDNKNEIDMMKVNIFALTQMTKLFLPGMVERGEGKVLNVSSIGAFGPGPLMAVYFASKSYVLYFSEAMANELKGTGVTATALCPGPTHSNFVQRGGMGGARLARMNFMFMDARSVARTGYRGLMRGKTVDVACRRNALMSLLPRLGPRDLTTAVLRFLYDKA